MDELEAEIRRGADRYGPILSPYDGIARLDEEIAELKSAVRRYRKTRLDSDRGAMASEATQVAALAIRIAGARFE